VVRFERRGDTTRLEFKCGQRALRDYRDKNDVINRLVSDMTVGYWELPDAVKRLRDENKALQSELKAAREQLSETEALSMLSAASTHGGWKILAQKLTTRPGTIVLFGIAGEKAQLLFGRADDVSVDMAQLLKTTLTVLNSDRGGGRPNFAQGGGVPANLEAIMAAIGHAEQAIRAAS
jgi:alanyl-tRNA synthetase